MAKSPEIIKLLYFPSSSFLELRRASISAILSFGAFSLGFICDASLYKPSASCNLFALNCISASRILSLYSLNRAASSANFCLSLAALIFSSGNESSGLIAFAFLYATTEPSKSFEASNWSPFFMALLNSSLIAFCSSNSFRLFSASVIFAETLLSSFIFSASLYLAIALSYSSEPTALSPAFTS